MCGIFGIVTSEEQLLGPTLTEAGRRLSYRGYDSVGCVTISDSGIIDLRKDVGKVDEVAEKYGFMDMYGRRGIMQLRWATFGIPSQANAQPHLDSDGDMVGAHNGNVVNNVELRQQFLDEGMIVRSTNDGESCVHAVERYVDRGFNVLDAIRMAYNDLKGDYSFVIGHIDEDCLYAFKKGSGLVVGIAEDSTCVSSDLPSILPLTRRILRMNDGEIVILRSSSAELRSVADGSIINRRIETITDNMEAAQKGGFPHFMLKEIHEQAVVAGELIRLLDGNPNIESLIRRIREARNVFLIGCGTSYHACLLGSVYFNRVVERVTIPILAPQFIAQYATAVNEDDIGIFVSQSGETKDVINAVEAGRKKGMGIFGLVNVLGSSLIQASEYYIPLACGYEISVPATKTFTNQAIVFLYLAMHLGGQPLDSLSSIPDLINHTIDMVEPQITAIEQQLLEWNDMYCLGFGLTYPIALEGALKAKEITYAHCEGMLSTEFKHGPLSAVSDGYPVLFVAGREDIPFIVSGINEVTCRGGYAIAVGEEDERLRANANAVLTIPSSEPEIGALLSVLPLQLLSYRLSIARGLNPDFPRNLSKTLTVD